MISHNHRQPDVQQSQNQANWSAGFTLIELLVAIVILGIVAAIVVFEVGGVSSKGQKSACKTDVKSVEVAEEAYYSAHNSYAPIATLLALPDPLLREAPSTTNGYVVGMNTATGEVTSTPACSSL